MAIEKLKTTRHKNDTWTNPQIKNHKNSHELNCSDHRLDIKIQNTCVFIFLTPSVEKTVIFHGFKKVYKPRNKNVLFSQCGS